MLKKEKRLSKKEFTRAFQKGSPFVFSDFIVKYIPNGLEFSRFGVSAGLKISKKAVERNAIRRKLYEAAKEQQGFLPKGDYIILVRQKSDPDVLKKSLTANLSNIRERILAKHQHTRSA